MSSEQNSEAKTPILPQRTQRNHRGFTEKKHRVIVMRIFSGKFRGRVLKSPKDADVIRPTQGYLREAVFNICQHSVEGAEFLDLFAGTGAIGFEALSRGAKHVTFVDSSREAIKYIKENARILGVEKNVTIIYGDAFKTVAKLAKRGMKYDIIYIDPPYAKKKHHDASGEIYSGDKALITAEDNGLIAPSGTVFVEGPRSGWDDNIDIKTLSLESSRSFSDSALRHFKKLKSPPAFNISA